MLEKDTNELLYTIIACAIAGMIIFGAKFFFPNTFAEVTDKIKDPGADAPVLTNEKTIYTSTSFTWDANYDTDNYAMNKDEKDATYYIVPEKLPDDVANLKIVPHIQSDQSAEVYNKLDVQEDGFVSYGQLQAGWISLIGTYDGNGLFHEIDSGNLGATYAMVQKDASDYLTTDGRDLTAKKGDYLLTYLDPIGYVAKDPFGLSDKIPYSEFASGFKTNYLDVICYNAAGDVIETIHIYPKASGNAVGFLAVE